MAHYFEINESFKSLLTKTSQPMTYTISQQLVLP